MYCVVNSSINDVSPFIALVGSHRHVIAVVDLQSDKYLQNSVIHFLVNIVGSYLVNYVSRIGVLVPDSSWVHSINI
jgi:hypothetical protein